MRKRSHLGCWLLSALCLSPVASAQSPRPDILWFAGGHPQVISVAYSPDGKVLASSGHFDDSVKLWRVSDGRMIRTLRTNNSNLFIFGPMVPLVFFPDGQTIIALGESAGPAFWNAADGQLVRKLSGTGTDLALNGDASLLAVATTSSIRLVRPNDGSLVRAIAWPGNFLQSVAFSRDGSVIAGGDRDGVLRTFRVADGAPLLDIPAHTDFINALAYSPDGARIATGSSDRTIKFWSATSGQPMGTLSGHTGFCKRDRVFARWRLARLRFVGQERQTLEPAGRRAHRDAEAQRHRQRREFQPQLHPPRRRSLQRVARI